MQIENEIALFIHLSMLLIDKVKSGVKHVVPWAIWNSASDFPLYGRGEIPITSFRGMPKVL